ncbi:MAG: 16S rRNA (guanine(966)-N(2))-methyltransferase RsmD [Nocardiopsaceae bacterium]|nr:16S rRNA (guanine(966)-N(2))-methyltransferase RsmD [Nocardiopsaceae bacterium]
MTRVIAGAAGGRRLAVPPGQSTRPTSDRAREGLFGTVLSEFGTLHGARVLDLYAGSGAVGLEALSRGAKSVLLVESDPRAAGVIRANIKAVGIGGAQVVTSRVKGCLAGPPRGTYDLVFADPPYAVTTAEIIKVLTLLAGSGSGAAVEAGPVEAGPVEAVHGAKGWLADGALVVVERATRSGPLDWPPGYSPGKTRRYGEATFWYGWHSAA